MKVVVTIAGRDVIVDWPDGGEPLVDGEAVAGDVLRVRPGVYSVLAGGRSYEVTLDSEVIGGGAPGEAGAPAGRDLLVGVDGLTLDVEVEDERGRALRARAGGAGAGAGTAAEFTVVAPMPGRVVAVSVAVGDAVERGQTVVVLEAMKMESALTTPHAGTVAEVLVSPGQTVQQRQPLVKIDG